MKNKKVAYLLVVLIAGIWAVILYRFFSFSSSSDHTVQIESSFIPPALSSGIIDTFSISANYRDPFLGKTETPSKSKKSKAVPIPKKAIEPLKWPVITYGGMIKSRKSNAQLCVVVINGQSNFMKEGDATSEVQLKRVFKDSIEVVFGKERRIMRK